MVKQAMTENCDRLAVVVGGSRGLGKSVAMHLASREMSVVVVGRDRAALEEVKAANDQYIDTVCLDVSLPESWGKLVHHLKGKRVDFLVHSASSVEPLSQLNKTSYSDWTEAFRLNVDAPVFITLSLQKNLHKDSRVLFISSSSAYLPIAGMGAYCSSKAALSMIGSIFSMEKCIGGYASFLPGLMDTNLQKKMRESSPEQLPAVEFFRKEYKNKELSDPQVSASFIEWLLLGVDNDTFKDQEWNIEDTEHLQMWKSQQSQFEHH